MLVAYEPASGDEWHHRIRVAEQTATRAITARPYSFCVAVNSKSRPAPSSSPVQVLRLALGVTATAGRVSFSRLTLYHIHPWDVVSIVEGDDDLFACSLTPAEFQANQDASLSNRVQKLTEAAAKIRQELRQRPVIAESWEEQKRGVQIEMRLLNFLYFDPEYQTRLLNGLELRPFVGDSAVQAEYQRRLSNIVDRHKLSIQLWPVSLGLILCHATDRRTKKGRTISLPFALLDI